jgi:beta-lactamase class C
MPATSLPFTIAAEMVNGQIQPMKLRAIGLLTVIFLAVPGFATVHHASDDPPADIKAAVDTAIQPLMAKYGIPGMAIGIVAGNKHYVFNYGVASIATRRPVAADTLFEIGSVSKTLTATLASYAQVKGYLSLSDKVSKYLPSLQGSKFGDVTLIELGTHTPGGLPLQVPDGIQNNDQLIQYFQKWRPAYPPGTYRTYNNPGIGTLGLITAKNMREDFAALMQQHVFAPLGMKDTFINVPPAKMMDYAQGYTQEGKPIRMAPGVLAAEAYGVKTTAADMIRFVEANMNMIQVEDTLQRAITDTHTGYFKAGAMTQDLIWEQYSYPVSLQALLEGNSSTMAFHATPVTAIKQSQKPQKNVWINKTGSTNGFGAYVAFIPEKRLCIVILANKNFPIDERVIAAYKILTSVAKAGNQGESSD